MSAQPLSHEALTMAECLPDDFSFLDEYQQRTYDRILWDETRPGTILGRNVAAYMLDGLVEEWGEITEPDKNEPGYSRMHAVLQTEGVPAFDPGLVTQTAVERHLKEFGDVSWYLANFLTIFNIPFSRIIEPGQLAWRLDNISQPRSNEAHGLQIERQFPWVKFASYDGKLLDSAKDLTREVEGVTVAKSADSRLQEEKALVISSGLFVLSTIHMLRARFDTTYKNVLDANEEKVIERLSRGTVFDKAGGDDR